MIHERVIFLSEKYDDGTVQGYCRSGGLIQAFHKDELESYKIKLENYYCDTDLKDQLYLVYYLETRKCWKSTRPQSEYFSMTIQRQ